MTMTFEDTFCNVCGENLLGSSTYEDRGTCFKCLAPEVGMPATLVMWSDRHACTVTRVVSDRMAVVQEDTARMVEGSWQSEHQVYEYSPDPNGRSFKVTKRKDGRWRPVGATGNAVVFGYRRQYRDPHF